MNVVLEPATAVVVAPTASAVCSGVGVVVGDDGERGRERQHSSSSNNAHGNMPLAPISS